jgi:hypothetical protein
MKKKVESGFSLNLGLFKLGRKKTTTELFKSTNVNLSQKLTGEIDLYYLHSKVWLDNVSGAQKKIASNYMNMSFIDNIYNTPISEIVDKWGPFVLSHYYAGGRAHALYVADHEENMSAESKESDFNKHLNISFSWKSKTPNQSDSASANFGKDYGNKDSLLENTKVSNVHNRIKLSGGAPEFQLTTQVGLTENNTIDLSGWLKSLSDTKTHVVVDIANEGLVGLDKFVLEDNFKRRIRDSHMGYLTEKDYQIPYIEIAKVFVRYSPSYERLYDVAAVLTTRHGDKIVFSDGTANELSDAELRANSDPTVFMNKANTIAAQKAQYFDCEIRANSSSYIKPYLRVPLAIELKKFNEGNLFKYKNPKTNIWYIYDMNSRVAFSYYDEMYIPWVYGTLNWFELVPEKSIPMSVLYQLFTIIGL